VINCNTICCMNKIAFGFPPIFESNSIPHTREHVLTAVMATPPLSASNSEMEMQVRQKAITGCSWTVWTIFFFLLTAPLKPPSTKQLLETEPPKFRDILKLYEVPTTKRAWKHYIQIQAVPLLILVLWLLIPLNIDVSTNFWIYTFLFVPLYSVYVCLSNQS